MQATWRLLTLGLRIYGFTDPPPSLPPSWTPSDTRNYLPPVGAIHDSHEILQLKRRHGDTPEETIKGDSASASGECMPLHMPIEVIVAKNLPAERLRPVDRVRHRARFQDRRSVPFLVTGPPYVHTGPRRVTVGVHGDCFVGKFRCNVHPRVLQN